MSPIRAVLVDIDGVLCTADAALPGSREAMAGLRRSAAGIRFVTNATRRCRADIVRQLRALGFEAAEHEVVTAALAARRMLEARGLRPRLLVHPGLLPDFAGLATEPADAVVVGDAADGFTYEALNAAFRVLAGTPGAPLIAIAMNRYFRAADGLALDAGPFVAALEYAARVRAEVAGKPSAALFETALADLRVPPEAAVMIGDDVESDVGGARAAGLRAVLVRTGKYRPGDEARGGPAPDAVADDLRRAVEDWLLPRIAGGAPRGA